MLLHRSILIRRRCNQWHLRLSYPPLGVEVIWEFQEFQELKTSQSNFKRRKRVAKIKGRQMFDRHVHGIHYVSNLISSCSIDLVFKCSTFLICQFIKKCLLFTSVVGVIDRVSYGCFNCSIGSKLSSGHVRSSEAHCKVKVTRLISQRSYDYSWATLEPEGTTLASMACSMAKARASLIETMIHSLYLHGQNRMQLGSWSMHAVHSSAQQCATERGACINRHTNYVQTSKHRTYHTRWYTMGWISGETSRRGMNRACWRFSAARYDHLGSISHRDHRYPHLFKRYDKQPL